MECTKYVGSVSSEEKKGGVIVEERSVLPTIKFRRALSFDEGPEQHEEVEVSGFTEESTLKLFRKVRKYMLTEVALHSDADKREQSYFG